MKILVCKRTVVEVVPGPNIIESGLCSPNSNKPTPGEKQQMFLKSDMSNVKESK